MFEFTLETLKCLLWKLLKFCVLQQNPFDVALTNKLDLSESETWTAQAAFSLLIQCMIHLGQFCLGIFQFHTFILTLNLYYCPSVLSLYLIRMHFLKYQAPHSFQSECQHP